MRRAGARDVASVAVAQYIAAGAGLATTILVARILGPTAYGLAAIIIAFPALVGSIASVKSSYVTIRYITRFHEAGSYGELESICALGYRIDALAAIAAFSLVATTGHWVSAHVTRNPQGTGLATAYAASLIVQSAGGTSTAVLASLRRFRLLGAIQIAESTSGLLFVVAAALMGFGVRGIVLGAAAANVAGGLFFLAATVHLLRSHAVHPFRLKRARVGIPKGEIASLFGWSYLTLTLTGLLSQFPLLLFGRLRLPTQAGYYRIARAVVTTGTYLEAALSKVAYPVLSRRWAIENAEDPRLVLRRWMKQRGLPVGALVLAGIPLMPLLVPVLIGPRYRPMVPGLQLLLLGAAVSAVFFFNAPYYLAAGRLSWWAKAFGLYTIVSLAGEWFAAVQFGFMGLAVAASAGTVAFNLGVGVPLMRRGPSPLPPQKEI